ERAQPSARRHDDAARPTGETTRGTRGGAEPAARSRDDRAAERGRAGRGRPERTDRGDRREHGERGPRPERSDRPDRPGSERRARGEARRERSRDGGQASESRSPRGPHSQLREDSRSAGSSGVLDLRAVDSDLSSDRHALSIATLEGPTARLDPRRPVAPSDDLDLDAPTTPAIPWGKDDDGPPAVVALAPDLPEDAPADDPDPVSHPLLEQPSAPLGDDLASVTGIRFVPGGRVQWFDAGDVDYARGERVMVEAERGTRLAWVAVPPARRAVRERGLRRVIRRASEQDLRGERDSDAGRAQALRIAKDKAAALRLPLKVFRVELYGQPGRGARLNVYYTTDERLDLRDFIRDVSSALGGARVELRQLGVRDEAKAVGGIGSCGLTLCCTTWLPDFVPVSIKMAKDQGLVLSPTKVSGQCGRLKCCLVYEQAAYAELRKGLPKLGKRVIAARGEGRVVEVDVLRQRVRVSYGPGDTEVVPATDVRPMFPSGNQPSTRGAAASDRDEADDADDSELAIAVADSFDAAPSRSRAPAILDDEPAEATPPQDIDPEIDPADDAMSGDLPDPPADDDPSSA
ncbi:MAG TPA: regulatory iron-sulfur-containing complex subunit RicT, partial [Kofleriaceae bacterium]|nr:regulatory iron-sulfur-containing complex subunit RicT [Kofleriaceae bacterium]